MTGTGEIEIKLNRRTWRLKPSFKAIREAEALTKVGVLEMYRRAMDSNATATDITAIVYCCLKEGLAEGESIPSQDEVGEWIYEANFFTVARHALAMLMYVLAKGRHTGVESTEKKIAPEETTISPTSTGS